MPAAYRASGSGGGSSGTANRTVTVTAAIVDDLLVVFVNVSNNTQDLPTVTDDHADGLGAYTHVDTVQWTNTGGNSCRGSIHVRNAKLGSTDTSFVITANTGSNTSGVVGWVALSGMIRVGNQDAVRFAAGGAQNDQASGGTPAPALLASALSSNVTITACFSEDTTTSPNASWTERIEANQASPTIALEVNTRNSGFTGTTITFGAACTSNTWASYAMEMDGSVLPLVADSGSYTLAGGAASLEWGHLIAADSGSYSLTGGAAGLLHGYPLSAASGSYTLTGGDASLEYGRRLDAESGSYSLTGSDVTLTYGGGSPPPAMQWKKVRTVRRYGSRHYRPWYVTRVRLVPLVTTVSTEIVLAAESGEYTLTGGDAGLRAGWKIATDSGTYTLTGTDAGLKRGYPLAAASGSYSLTGGAAGLLADRKIVADSGSYALTGGAAGLLRGYPLVAASGTYNLTGGAAGLLHGYPLTAASGTYNLTGGAVSLEYGRRLAADSGSYSLTGQDVTLVYSGSGSKIINAESGAYALTGQAAGLLAARKLTADSGSYTLTGQAAGLNAGRRLTADSGSYALTGQASGLLFGRRLAANSGNYTLTGQDAAFPIARRLVSGQGAYALTGQDALLTYSGAVVPIGAPYTQFDSKSSATFRAPRRMSS